MIRFWNKIIVYFLLLGHKVDFIDPCKADKSIFNHLAEKMVLLPPSRQTNPFFDIQIEKKSCPTREKLLFDSYATREKNTLYNLLVESIHYFIAETNNFICLSSNFILIYWSKKSISSITWINIFPVLDTISFLFGGRKMDFFAPHGQ